jgi:hypothetical protein
MEPGVKDGREGAPLVGLLEHPSLQHPSINPIEFSWPPLLYCLSREQLDGNSKLFFLFRLPYPSDSCCGA